MTNGPFFKTDYPQFLLDELGTRFNNALGQSPSSLADMTVFSYDKNSKEYTVQSAKFTGCFLKNYNAGTQYTAVNTAGQAVSLNPNIVGTSANTTSPPVYVQSYYQSPTSVTSNSAPTITPNTTTTSPTTTISSLAATSGMYNESIAITDIKIDIGGTLGKVSRAEVTIKGGGRERLEIVTDTITQLGNRVDLEIKAGGWSFPQSDEANTVKYTGRIYDFTFNFNEAKGRFSTTIKMVGLAEALSNINAFPEFSPKKVPYPSGWPKEFTPRNDGSDSRPVNNLLILLDALWKQAFGGFSAEAVSRNGTRQGGHRKIPGISAISTSVQPYLYIGDRPPSIISDAGFTTGGTVVKEYINLEGLRAVLMKVLEITSDQADNKIAKQLDITYATDSNGKLVTNGSMASYLNSANPERILLFNTPVGVGVSKNGAPPPPRVTYYHAPRNISARYATGPNASVGNIGNIYISRDVIFQAAGAKEGDTRYDVAGNKSIEKFLGSIFETIKNETGNIIDLILLPDFDAPNTGADQKRLFIIDSNFTGPTAGNEIIEFPLFPNDTSHFRDVTAAPINLTAKVPKSLATKAFVKDANFVAVEQDSVDGEEAADDNTFDPNEVETELSELNANFPSSDTREDDSARRRELMAKLWQRHVHDTGAKSPKENIASTAENRNIQTALELSMTSFGINGYKWGQAIALDYIPKTAPENTLFSIKNITHNFSFDPTQGQGGKWDTQISCNAHIRPAAEKNMAKSVTELKSSGAAKGSGYTAPTDSKSLTQKDPKKLEQKKPEVIVTDKTSGSQRGAKTLESN
jgi:hypothetical protein